MTMTAAGVAKLIEECGELQQILGKKLAYWYTDEHPDGAGPISKRIEQEMGDVLAAIEFCAEMLGLDRLRIELRRAGKRDLFGTWQEQLDNNDMGLDHRTAVEELVRDHLAKRGGHHYPGIDRCPLCSAEMSLRNIQTPRRSGLSTELIN